MIASSKSAFSTTFLTPSAIGERLAAIGREQPVVFDASIGSALLLRHRDVSRALRDSSTFSTKVYGMGGLPSTAMLARDGDEHRRQRRIHNRFLSASATARYADRVELIAAHTFGRLAGRESAELIGELIVRYPMDVIFELLGVPNELGDQGLAWVRAIIKRMAYPHRSEFVKSGTSAFTEMAAYTKQLVDRERKCLGDNLLGEIIRGHVAEDAYAAGAVTEVVMSLLLGGFETTVQMLSSTLVSLLLHPAALDQVRARQSLAAKAIDEAFRWANPTVGIHRLVLQDTEIGGTLLSAGTQVYLCIAAAHYDQAVHRQPALFKLDRNEEPHLGFGAGPHYCIGAALAKIETLAALRAILSASPRLRLAPEAGLSFRYGARDFTQHGSETLPVLL